MIKRKEYELVEVARIFPRSRWRGAWTVAEFNVHIAKILATIPDQFRSLVTIRIEAKPEHLYGETEHIDMEDISCWPVLVLSYAKEKVPD